MPLMLIAGQSSRYSTAAAAWRLAAGHFIPAKMMPQIIFPRPDAETAAWARNRRAPSSLQWQIPICVQGGAWPGHYEIVSNGGASGLTIGADLPSDWLTNGLQSYGVLSWSSPVVGTYTIEVKYTDQDLNTVTRTFTLDVIDRENTTYFVFVNAATGSNANSGAYSAPKLNHAGWYGANKNDLAHQNKQVFFFGGTYSVAAFPAFEGDNLQKVAMTSVKPHVFVAISGETVTFDNNSQAYWEYQTHPGDQYFEDVRWTNPQVTENGLSRKTHIRNSLNPDRSTFFRVRFIGTVAASDSGTNSAAVMWGGNPDPGNYFAISQCTFDALDNQDLALFYDTRDVVLEGNRIVNGYGSSLGGSAGGFFLKANSIQRVSCRANVGIGAGISLPLLYFSQFVETATDERSDIEFCWNSYRNDSTRTAGEGAGAVGIGQGTGTFGNHYGRFWSYRNNMRVAHNSLIGIDAYTPAPGPAIGPFEFEKDVIQHSGTYVDGFFIMDSSEIPARLTKTDLATGTALVDATTNLLTGASRTTYLGTHGCEAV